MFQGMDYVYAVYKERSFSKAAEKLFISQPSLSANVKRVEQAVGYPIFDRSTKPIGLTEPGKKYIQTILQMKAMQAEFSEYLNDLGSLRTGKLTLGGSSLYSSLLYPRLIQQFTKQFPLIQINLKESNTVQLEKMLLNGEIDLLLDNCEMDSTIFDHQILRKEHILLAVPGTMEINTHLKEYQVSADAVRSRMFLDDSVPVVDLKAFSTIPFIMLSEENGTRILAMELCRQSGFHPHILFELEQQMTSFTVTCSGLGASFVSDTLISNLPAHANVVFYKLNPEASARNLYFYWKKGRYFSNVIKEFLKSASDYSD